MADVFTKTKRSHVMAAIHSRGNEQTEIALVRILRRHRISGWKRHHRTTGNPDFAFCKERVAVFVDGCFWHGCRKHSRLPKSNQQYWEKKLDRNKARDRRITQELRRDGWRVVRLWEHDLAREQAIVIRLRIALGRLSPVTGTTRKTRGS